MNSFEKLYKIDCAPYFKQKESFGGKKVDYLEWATAWKLLKENYPEATYEIKRFETVPYLKTECGFFVEVAVTIEGRTETELYPVTDGQYSPIEMPDTRDIADAHQRALVKAIARHGLGLSAWEKHQPNQKTFVSNQGAPIRTDSTSPCTPAQAKMISAKLNAKGLRGADAAAFLNPFGSHLPERIPFIQVDAVVKAIEKYSPKKSSKEPPDREEEIPFDPDVSWGTR